MSRSTSRLALTLAAVAALLIAWSTAAPWAAGARGSSERYKVSLFGVWRIVGVTSTSTDEVRCAWHDTSPGNVCTPAPGHAGQYARLALARWFVIGSVVMVCFGLIALGRDKYRLAGRTFLLGGIATIVAIVLVRTTVRTALAVLADTRLTIDGTGLNAAQVASTLMLVAGAVLLSSTGDE